MRRDDLRAYRETACCSQCVRERRAIAELHTRPTTDAEVFEAEVFEALGADREWMCRNSTVTRKCYPALLDNPEIDQAWHRDHHGAGCGWHWVRRVEHAT